VSAVSLQRRRVVRVPASSANLGPGFDVLAAALSLHFELEVVETGSFAVHTDLTFPCDRSNLVVRAFEALHPADGFEFRIHSEIPLCGGLGSSAAAVLAGLLAADHLFELDADVLTLATELEGHPDNVGAALNGGFVVCDGTRVDRFEAPPDLEAVLVIPSEPVETARARAALPAAIPLGDVSFNAAALARLMLGLVHGDWDLVAAGLRDRVPQPYRAGLYPRSAQLVEEARELGAIGATISGAGPAVLVWTSSEQTGPVVASLKRATAGWATVIRARFESQGAYVTSL
jgi:homoserine kinase